MSIFRQVLLTPGDTSIYSDKYFRFLTTTTHFVWQTQRHVLIIGIETCLGGASRPRFFAL